MNVDTTLMILMCPRGLEMGEAAPTIFPEVASP